MRAIDYEEGDLIGGTFQVRRVFGGAGASGMGVVYLVDEREHEAAFVLKACQRGNSALASQFKREADTWVSIGSHPNVAKALWVRLIDEQLFVAAEYVDGVESGLGSLADAVGRHVTPVQILRWAMQFCSGLNHALSRGLIAHRDVKPANLLLTSHGDLKIADFGLGKVTPPNSIASSKLGIAATGTAGTPPYMAPEQIVGAKVDCRCDIYAFGIVLYELCSQGAYPYDVSPPVTSSTFATAHLRGVVKPLDSPFWPLIEKCLKRGASERWQSPADLADALFQLAKYMGLSCSPFVPPQPVELEELYTKAQSLSALGRPKEALDAVNEYLNMVPGAFWAWTEKGRIHMEMGHDLEAEEATRRSLLLDQTNSHAWNNLGLVLRRLNRSEKSCDAFEHALECDPLNGGAMMNSAQVLCELRRYERAANLLCRALSHTPKKQVLLFNAGNLVGFMLKGRDFKSAEKVARAIIEADSNNSQSWHNLGLIQLSNGNHTEGLKCLRAALQIEPSNSDSRLLLARACADVGLFVEAISHLDRLIAECQQLAKAICFKAQLLAHNGMGKDAIELLERFLDEAPTEDSAWFVLCSIAESQQDIRKALRAASACESILKGRGVSADSEDARWANNKVRQLRVRLERK